VSAATWDLADIPDQTGRTIVVTGPTVGGLGHHTALELARRGARVVLAGRNEEKVSQTVTAIRGQVPKAHLDTLRIDLADLGSVRRAAAAAARLGPIDVLV
jgi:NAD(P)-dependent dehydrogenase (short-subunit alcohol dehydrogenase family)